MKFRFNVTSFDQACASARQTLQEHGLKIVAEIPTSRVLSESGFRIPQLHQIFFFRPDFMYSIVTSAPEEVMSAPLKMVIRQADEGFIEGICQDPIHVFSTSPACERFKEDMHERITRAIHSL